MRPPILSPLFQPARNLPGIGPRGVKLLEKLTGGARIIDLLWHMPSGVLERKFYNRITEAPPGQTVTLQGRVGHVQWPRRRGGPVRVKFADDSAELDLVFFNVKGDWLARHLPENTERVVSGKLDLYQGRLQMAHPDRIAPPEQLGNLHGPEPVYPLTQGLTQAGIRRAIRAALAEYLPELPEWLDPDFLTRQGWPDWKRALKDLHHPEKLGDTMPENPSRSRLAYDELLSAQLALGLIRARQTVRKGRSLPPADDLRGKAMTHLPFALTGDQQKALEDIDADMAAPNRMLRLLQGDVGSGKTVVAWLALLNAVGSGAQGAIMAPTEILARQHAETLKPWAEACGIRMVTLTGRDKGKQRETLLKQIGNGAAQIVIGTHALFQEKVAFHDLGLAVVDEQHRFGVHQRLTLGAKGKGADVLVMTATPIPRTLTLTVYGDMDVSRLREKPPGRKPIDTRVISRERLDEVIQGLRRKTDSGAQAYWVCPLVEDSEKLDLEAAEARFEALKPHFGPDRIGLVHGRMTAEDKEKQVAAFAAGDLKILVATTVIEVGINVPNATIMIIEHAEHFGLAQLHQLRGRVGRGSEESTCLLLYGSQAGETAKRRLETLRRTEDGFEIAEEDLRLRGAGEILGTRQSGMPVFRLADPGAHQDLMQTARDDARLILHKDPELQTRRGQALRHLLYLFEKDQAIQLLASG